jgi:hypothetical protein
MPVQNRRGLRALQDAELIPLGDLLTELNRAIGVTPAQAAIREAWLSGTVAFIGKKLVFANAKAALEVDLRFVVATEHVQIPPATLVRQELLGLTVGQLADSKTATLTTTGDLFDARGRLFVFAIRNDAARRWPGIIAPPPAAAPPAIESSAQVPPPPQVIEASAPKPELPATRPKGVGRKVWTAALAVREIDPKGTATGDRLLDRVREHTRLPDLSRRTLGAATKFLREIKLR